MDAIDEKSRFWDTPISVTAANSRALRWLNMQHVGIPQVDSIRDWDRLDKEKLGEMAALKQASWFFHASKQGTLHLRMEKSGDSTPLRLSFGGKTYSLVEENK